MGEEAATPGLPVALARATGLSPGNFTLEKPPDAAGSAAIIRQIQELTFFAATHSGLLCCARQQKTLTRLCRSCGRSLFPVEAFGNLRTSHHPTRSSGAESKDPALSLPKDPAFTRRHKRSHRQFGRFCAIYPSSSRSSDRTLSSPICRRANSMHARTRSTTFSGCLGADPTPSVACAFPDGSSITVSTDSS